jgi:hypothetical protein
MQDQAANIDEKPPPYSFGLISRIYPFSGVFSHNKSPTSMETMAAAIEHAMTANQANHHPALN